MSKPKVEIDEFSEVELSWKDLEHNIKIISKKGIKSEDINPNTFIFLCQNINEIEYKRNFNFYSAIVYGTSGLGLQLYSILRKNSITNLKARNLLFGCSFIVPLCAFYCIKRFYFYKYTLNLAQNLQPGS